MYRCGTRAVLSVLNEQRCGRRSSRLAYAPPHRELANAHPSELEDDDSALRGVVLDRGQAGEQELCLLLGSAVGAGPEEQERGLAAYSRIEPAQTAIVDTPRRRLYRAPVMSYALASP
jgi:hypothetical protein